MSNSNSEEATASSGNRAQDYSTNTFNCHLFTPVSPTLQQSQPKAKRKRGQPGNPDPDAEVIALSPRSLMTTNRFVCEICNKGFQRDQNLQLHKRGHNLPWKLRQKSSKEVAKKRVYVCPEESCVHHHPSRALGDLTGIKKHYCRKHGEKKWKCEKCSKKYAVHSDWKTHVKTCGTREYKCDCGILFARKDSFITHRAFCDALAEESARLLAFSTTISNSSSLLPFPPSPWGPLNPNPNLNLNPTHNPNPNPNPSPFFHVKFEDPLIHQYPYNLPTPSPHLSATELLQKASLMGSTSSSGHHVEQIAGPTCSSLPNLQAWQRGDRLTRDFLGVAAPGEEEELLSFNGPAAMNLITADRGGEPTKPFTSFAFGFPADEECPCFL